MADYLKLKKQLRTSMVLLVVIILPGLSKAFGSSAFEGVRAVDLAVLFASGVGTGSLLMTVITYFRLNKNGEKSDIVS